MVALLRIVVTTISVRIAVVARVVASILRCARRVTAFLLILHVPFAAITSALNALAVVAPVRAITILVVVLLLRFPLLSLFFGIHRNTAAAVAVPVARIHARARTVISSASAYRLPAGLSSPAAIAPVCVFRIRSVVRHASVSGRGFLVRVRRRSYRVDCIPVFLYK